MKVGARLTNRRARRLRNIAKTEPMQAYNVGCRERICNRNKSDSCQLLVGSIGKTCTTSTEKGIKTFKNVYQSIAAPAGQVTWHRDWSRADQQCCLDLGPGRLCVTCSQLVLKPCRCPDAVLNVTQYHLQRIHALWPPRLRSAHCQLDRAVQWGVEMGHPARGVPRGVQ